MVAVTLKKIVQKERKAIKMLCHMAEQPKLKRYESQIKNYCERLRDETKTILVEIVQMLQQTCIANAKNIESRAFFLNLLGDFYRYQIELIPE